MAWIEPGEARVDDDYLALGRLIAAQCPQGFAQAVLEAQLVGKQADLEIGASMADGTEIEPPLDSAGVHDIHVVLDGIREKMAAADGRRWRSCTVTLVAGGGFAMDVKY
jgi:hypothetical protein